MMRAKMVVQSVKAVRPFPGQHSGPSEEIEFSAVGGKYGEDGNSEDNTYAKYTPTARLSMVIANPALMDKIQPGQTFYVDFTEVPE